MKFTQKIMLLPILSAVVFVFILGGAFWMARQGAGMLEVIQNEFDTSRHLGHELELIVVRMPHLLQSAITAGDADMLVEADALHDDFHELMDRAARLPGVSMAEIDTTITMFDDYYALAREASSRMIESNLDVPDEVYVQLGRMRTMHDALQQRSRTKAAEIEERLQQTVEKSRRRAGRAATVVILLTIGILVLSVTISIGVIASIIRPLSSMRDTAEAIAHGDLNQPLDYRSDDDLGRLADAFRGMQGSLIRDISRREEAEARVRESEERLSLALDAATDGLWDLDVKSHSFYYSPRYAQMLGYELEDLPTSTAGMRKWIHPDDLTLLDSSFSAHLEHDFPFDIEVRVQHKDGQWFWVQMRGKIVSRDETGRPLRVVGTIVDIRTRKATEQQLIEQTIDLEKAINDLRAAQTRLVQSEKLASLGQLVAGISHELNNPIGAVNASIDVMDRAVGKLEEALAEVACVDDVKGTPAYQRALNALKEGLGNTDRASVRIIELVSGLKHFSHLDEADLQQVDLVRGLESTLSVVAHEFGERITVVREYGELPRITCYPGEINQVFLNLLTNAVKAIEDTGVITITTEATEKSVRVSVSDTGRGIAENQLERIFDIGFANDHSRVKMHWGLATAYQIVQRHRGDISISSEVGVGTTVVIELPLFLS